MKDNVLFINNNNYLLYARHCTGWSTSIIYDFCNNSPCRHFISNNSQRGRNQRHFVNCWPHPTLTQANIRLHNKGVCYSSFQIPNRYPHSHSSHSNLLSYSQSHSQSLPTPSSFPSPLRKKKKNRKKTTSSDTWHGNLTNKLKTKGVCTSWNLTISPGVASTMI